MNPYKYLNYFYSENYVFFQKINSLRFYYFKQLGQVQSKTKSGIARNGMCISRWAHDNSMAFPKNLLSFEKDMLTPKTSVTFVICLFCSYNFRRRERGEGIRGGGGKTMLLHWKTPRFGGCFKVISLYYLVDTIIFLKNSRPVPTPRKYLGKGIVIKLSSTIYILRIGSVSETFIFSKTSS